MFVSKSFFFCVCAYIDPMASIDLTPKNWIDHWKKLSPGSQVWLWPFMTMMKVSTNDSELVKIIIFFFYVFLSLLRYENGHCPPEKGTRFKGKGSFFKHHFSGDFAVSSWGNVSCLPTSSTCWKWINVVSLTRVYQGKISWSEINEVVSRQRAEPNESFQLYT